MTTMVTGDRDSHRVSVAFIANSIQNQSIFPFSALS